MHDFSDFSEVYDFSDGFTTQSQNCDYNMILGQISLWSIIITIGTVIYYTCSFHQLVRAQGTSCSSLVPSPLYAIA